MDKKLDFKKLSSMLPKTRKTLKVGIIGAGMAGLSAAFELKNLGHQVKVFESNDRIGGRVYTHRFEDGITAELGAMRIPKEHDATLHYVDTFGLKKRAFVNTNKQAFYYIRETKSRIAEWEKIANAYRLPQYQRGIEPNHLLREFMEREFEKIPVKEKLELFSIARISSDLVKDFESQSFLQKATDPNSPHSLSQELFDLIADITGLSQYQHASFLEVIIDFFGLFEDEQFELEGGMESLSLGFKTKIGSDRILTNQKVYGIRIDNLENEVVLHHQNKIDMVKRSESFDYVICTAPAPATARIDFLPKLDPKKSDALRRVSYESSSKSVYLVKERIWEIQDGFSGGGSFTDKMSQQCWYPSDNATYDHVKEAFVPRDLAISRSKSAITGSYTWGNNSRQMSALDDNGKDAEIIKFLEKIHPGIERDILDVKHHSWNDQEGPGGGAFAYFAPGDHSRYMALMQAPYPTERPKVFFAGEHLDVEHAWIQGALKSSLKAAQELLSQQLKEES